MTRLLPALGVVSTGLILVALGMGYAAAAGLASPLRHVGLAILATLGVLLYQSICLFFLVGSPFRLRQVVREERLDPELLAGMPALGKVLPLGILALAAAMAAYILGGGAHTGALSPRIHGLLALVAAAAQAGSVLQGRRALGALDAVIRRLEDALG